MDVLDFYRGTLSARRLGVLVRQLPVESALVRVLNGGRTPWGDTEHLIADLWALTLQAHSGDRNSSIRDHPVRAEMESKVRNEAKLARVIELKALFEKRRHAYGLGGDAK